MLDKEQQNVKYMRLINQFYEQTKNDELNWVLFEYNVLSCNHEYTCELIKNGIIYNLRFCKSTNTILNNIRYIMFIDSNDIDICINENQSSKLGENLRKLFKEIIEFEERKYKKNQKLLEKNEHFLLNNLLT